MITPHNNRISVLWEYQPVCLDHHLFEMQPLVEAAADEKFICEWKKITNVDAFLEQVLCRSIVEESSDC